MRVVIFLVCLQVLFVHSLLYLSHVSTDSMHILFLMLLVKQHLTIKLLSFELVLLHHVVDVSAVLNLVSASLDVKFMHLMLHLIHLVVLIHLVLQFLLYKLVV